MSSPIATWSAEGQERAQQLLALYPDKRSAVMPLLYVASLEHGHVTNEGMQQVAELIGVTATQVRSVATFYTMYKHEPVGRYLVSVCTSISCHLLGGDEVLDAACGAAGVEVGGTSEDDLVTVERVECIGACGGAPAVQVNYELIEGVTDIKAIDLIDWLRNTTPEVVLADELQQLFGGQKSFDWGVPEPDGAIAPVPAFGPYGSAEEGR